MTVHIKADERIGRTVGEPYISVVLERRADLDRGLTRVERREVASIRLEIGYSNPTPYLLAPRHLDNLIDLLTEARDRMNDIETAGKESAREQATEQAGAGA